MELRQQSTLPNVTSALNAGSETVQYAREQYRKGLFLTSNP